MIFISILVFRGFELSEINYEKNNIYSNIIIVIFSIFCCLVIYNLYFTKDIDEILKRYPVMIITFASIVFLILIVCVKATYSNKILDERDGELENLKRYIYDVELAYTEFRKFKHDHLNIISSIGGYIDEKDLTGLENYFNTSILKASKVLEVNSLKLATINNIENTEIKGIINIKLLQALERGIDVNLEVVEKINNINMQTLELCRIIGILLDNAIEAAELSNDKIINVALVSNNNVKVIIVKNSYNGEKPNINLIFKEGYSTKNNNSGLGLKILKDIANKQRNIILDTRIDENYFTQIINIY